MLTQENEACVKAQALVTMLQRAANDGDEISVIDLIARGADPAGSGV